MNTDGHRFRGKVFLICVHLCSSVALLSCLAGTKVSVDENNVLVIDGRKVFPIGFTMPPPPDGKTPAGKDAIGELHDAGANFLRTGVMGGAWDDAAIELEQRWQDVAAKHGMHCLVHLRELAKLGADPATAERDEAMLRKIVSRFKDHPAMA